MVCAGAQGQSDLEERVRVLESENRELRKQVHDLKRIRSEWFRWKYGLTTPERVLQHEAHREKWEKV